jgi:transposase-like protein
MADLTFTSHIELLPVEDVPRRRRWSDADKIRVVEESHRGHRQVSATARRLGISRGLLTVWRRQYRNGELSMARGAAFVPVMIAPTRKPRKKCRSLKQMHEDLVKLGYDGSYGRVAAFARAWRADRLIAEQTTGRGTYVPLIFQPGEAFQFDWSEDWSTIGCERVKLQVALPSCRTAAQSCGLFARRRARSPHGPHRRVHLDLPRQVVTPSRHWE